MQLLDGTHGWAAHDRDAVVGRVCAGSFDPMCRAVCDRSCRVLVIACGVVVIVLGSTRCAVATEAVRSYLVT